MKFPLWLQALGAAMLAQTISTFMGQSLPVLAPLLTASAGVAPERIGNLSSLSSFAFSLSLPAGFALLPPARLSALLFESDPPPSAASLRSRLNLRLHARARVRSVRIACQ